MAARNWMSSDGSGIPPPPAEHTVLAGHPKKALVKSVRRTLSIYGFKPIRDSETWRLAWQWAYDVAISYYRTTWPSPHEIATQYVVLLLSKMRDDGTFRLPYRAKEKLSPRVQQALQLTPKVELLLEHEASK